MCFIYHSFIITYVNLQKVILSYFLHRFFMYQLANVYLILLAGSVFDSLEDAISDPASIINLIGELE